MPLVSRTIPNLVQGISQQPEVLRLSSQATTQLNGFSSVVEGLKKRPPTNYIAKLSSSTFGNAFLHTINRDVAERYIVVIKTSLRTLYFHASTICFIVSFNECTNVNLGK